jgi:hypothetical protein
VLRTLMIGDLPQVDAAARAAVRAYTLDAQLGAGGGSWSYTVAADVVNLDRSGKATPAGTQFFTVTLARDPAGGGCAGWTAVTLPAQVAGPTRPGDMRTGYGQQLPNAGTPLADTLGRFFTALLTGGAGEDLARYTSPGSTIRPILPAPYTAIRIDGLYATADAHVGAAGGVGTVPADGTRIRVLARVAVRTAEGQTEWLLSYPLTVAVRGGRWEVAAIDPAPALVAPPGPRASSSGSPGAGPPGSSAPPMPASPSTIPSGSHP